MRIYQRERVGLSCNTKYRKAKMRTVAIPRLSIGSYAAIGAWLYHSPRKSGNLPLLHLKRALGLVMVEKSQWDTSFCVRDQANIRQRIGQKLSES